MSEISSDGCTVEWTPARPMGIGSDPLSYCLQISRLRDQQFNQVRNFIIRIFIILKTLLVLKNGALQGFAVDKYIIDVKCNISDVKCCKNNIATSK